MNQTEDRRTIEGYYAQAQAFAAKSRSMGGASPAVMISPKSDEWGSWGMYYLRTYGRLPALYRMCVTGLVKEFCVPARWPEWFDTGYAAGPDARPSKAERDAIFGPDRLVSPEERARVIAAFAKLKLHLPDANDEERARRRREREFRRQESLAEVQERVNATVPEMSPSLRARLAQQGYAVFTPYQDQEDAA